MTYLEWVFSKFFCVDVIEFLERQQTMYYVNSKPILKGAKKIQL